jgi:hypothetical protein
MGLRDELERLGYHMLEMRIVNDQGRRRAGFGVGVFRELAGDRFVTVRRSELARPRPTRVQSLAMRSCSSNRIQTASKSLSRRAHRSGSIS